MFANFYNKDCVEGSQQYLKDSSIDLFICDPPFGIKADTFDSMYARKKNDVIDGYNEVQSDYQEFSNQWIKEIEWTLKPGGSVYIISGYTKLREILNSLHNTKLEEINHLIWKYNFPVWTTKKYVSSHYHILYYWKPGNNRTFNLETRYKLNETDLLGNSKNYQDRESVWSIKREPTKNEEKNVNKLPTQLVKKMIQYSSNEGDTICDFFLGNGTTAEVALPMKRNVIGFEINKKAYDHCCYRIKEKNKSLDIQYNF